MTRNLGFAAIFLTLAGVGEAQDTGWDQRLAETFSSRWSEIRAELAGLAPRLAKLPGIPIDDQGGTGGYSGSYGQSSPEGDERFAVEIHFRAVAEIDLIALVPARRYDASGLDAEYGLPEDFSVELLDADGKVLREVARERNTAADPVRRGHPFVYRVEPAVAAAALRISARTLLPSPEGDGTYVHAWAEAQAFEGGKNVAAGAQVRGIGGGSPSAPWRWGNAYLVDCETPLGLPEIPEEQANIGWISEQQDTPDRAIPVTVDLGALEEIDAVRLLPARKPTSDLPSGFGFPRKLAVAISETGKDADWRTVATWDLGNPGHNPVTVEFEMVRARYVRVMAEKLWKAFDDYPAYFALSELEVLAGDRNLALDKPVRSPDGMGTIIAAGGRIWSSAALCDGFGPDGRLVSTREWMELLQTRLDLETRRHRLRAESARLVAGWRRTGQTAIGALVLAGAFLIVVLPIRYRVHARRELAAVRERIAGDLHDEVGSNLGSIQMFADLAEGRAGPSDELKRIQRIAAETVSAVRDIVWLLRPSGDHRIATVEHLRETASIMLEGLDWKFGASEAAWGTELPEAANRDLFLYFREALHNILRHSKATRAEIRCERPDGRFLLAISDNGIGIDPDKLARPATLRALRQRATALGGALIVGGAPDTGTRLKLTLNCGDKRTRRGRSK